MAEVDREEEWWEPCPLESPPPHMSPLGLSGQKNHRTGGFNITNLFSHSSGDWKSKIKELAGLLSSDSCPHAA